MARGNDPRAPCGRSPIACEVHLRTPFLCLLVALLPGVLGAGKPARPPASKAVAIVASLKGRVEVTGARGGAQPAAFGLALQRGDRVSVGKGGGATLLLADGSVITLAERGSITMGGASKPVHATALPGEVFAHASQFATAGSRQTGLVTLSDMRSDAAEGAPLLLSPRNTFVTREAPKLRWRSVPGAARYRVRGGPAGGAEAWAREVPATAGAEVSLDFPADAARLAAGADYEWEVVALDDQGTLRREGAIVRLLPEETRASVEQNLARIAESAGGESAAARFLAGSYLSGLGLYDDAAREFEALVSLSPGSPEPHEALGNVYLKVGASDRAAAEFRQALALQRDKR